MSPDDPLFLLVRSVKSWRDQAIAATDRITELNGGTPPASLREAYAIDPGQFSLMIEAYFALAPLTGLLPNDELLVLAGLRPVGDVLNG